MKGIGLFTLLLFFVSLQNVSAKEVTVTLQNGLNGYAGCDDAFIADFDDAKNFGAADKIAVEFEEILCQSC